MGNLTDDPRIREWIQHQKGQLAALDESAIFASLVTENYLKSPECMLQVGAAICLGKPIILIVLDGVKVPPKLLAAADKIIHTDRDHMDIAHKAVAEFARSLP